MQIQGRHITPRLRLFGPGQRAALVRFVNTATLDCERGLQEGIARAALSGRAFAPPNALECCALVPNDSSDPELARLSGRRNPIFAERKIFKAGRKSWTLGLLGSGKGHQSLWSSPWTHEFKCLGRLSHRLGHNDIRRPNFDLVRAAQNWNDARQIQLAAGFSLQVMPFESRLDQYDL